MPITDNEKMALSILALLFCMYRIVQRVYLADETHMMGGSSHLSILFEPRHEKTNIMVSNLVRHKPGCTATEDG